MVPNYFKLFVWSVTKNFENHVDKIRITYCTKNHIFRDSKSIKKSCQNANKGKRLDKDPLIIGYNQIPYETTV